jgi:glycosyltransferase involved in cell wall biosynthesis
LNQTFLPKEIILVRDGVVPLELQVVIDSYVSNNLFTYLPLTTNVGLGEALNIGLSKAKYDLIARMDSDDIALPNRLEKQIECFINDPKLTVSGGQIKEFDSYPSKILYSRNVPLDDKEIRLFLKKRNPFNHMTVMFKKENVLKVNGYKDFYFLEDYFLWCRLSLEENKFSNLFDTLVLVRRNIDTLKRRGGIKYFKSLIKI